MESEQGGFRAAMSRARPLPTPVQVSRLATAATGGLPQAMRGERYQLTERGGNGTLDFARVPLRQEGGSETYGNGIHREPNIASLPRAWGCVAGFGSKVPKQLN